MDSTFVSVCLIVIVARDGREDVFHELDVAGELVVNVDVVVEGAVKSSLASLSAAATSCETGP